MHRVRWAIMMRALAMCTVVLAGCGRGADAPARRFARPAGVVLILIDALRADHVGVYGAERDLTPVLDSIARRGWVFENAWATSTWTRASVASLFSSLDPSVAGVVGRFSGLPEAVETLAETLTAAGVACAAISANGNAGPAFGFDQGFDRFSFSEIRRTLPNDRFPLMPADGITIGGLEWLRGRDPDRRFFLFLHYVDPHDPYVPPAGILPDPEPAGRFSGSRLDLARLARMAPAEPTPEDLARMRYLYAGEVRYSDHWVGKFLEGLEELGLRDEVLVVVTADHGEGLFEHLRIGHGKDLYEEVLQVPLIISWPGMTTRDAGRVGEVVSLLDVAPTILASWDLPVPEAYQGRDLSVLARGAAGDGQAGEAFAELRLDGNRMDAYRRGMTKLIRTQPEGRAATYEIYDLATDPREQHDLAAARPALLAELRGVLEGRVAANATRRTALLEVPVEQLDPEVVDQLKFLGYIEDEQLDPGQPAPADGTATRAVPHPDHP